MKLYKNQILFLTLFFGSSAVLAGKDVLRSRVTMVQGWSVAPDGLNPDYLKTVLSQKKVQKSGEVFQGPDIPSSPLAGVSSPKSLSRRNTSPLSAARSVESSSEDTRDSKDDE